MKGIFAHGGKKWRFLTKTDRGPPTKEAGTSAKKTCIYEGEYVDMKAKSKGFWLKLIGCTLGKRMEHHQKCNLCLWRGICVHEAEKERFLIKTDGGFPKENGGKSGKTQLVFMKGNMCLWRGQVLSDVLSCIMLLLLMFWAVSRFCCWCLELYQVSVADALSCIMLLLLMSWAVSRFCCWCFELYQVSLADVLSCVTLR